ncbi:MAG: response regulator [Acidobacteriota bacterium]
MQRKILIADDNVTMRKEWQQLLQGQGYDVVTVGNGDLAIAKIHEFRPHMVMLDVIMPGKTGYEVCDYIKTQTELSETPVILTFSENEPFDLSEARRVGATRCVPKSIDPESLIVILNFIWAGVTPIEYAQPFSEINRGNSAAMLEESVSELEITPVSEEDKAPSEDDHSAYMFEIKIEAPTVIEERPIEELPAPLEIHAEANEVEIPGLEASKKRTQASEQNLMEAKKLAAAAGITGSQLELAENLLEQPIVDDHFKFDPTYDQPEDSDDLLQITQQLNTSYCRECGARVETGDVFCVECGAAVDEEMIQLPTDLNCEQCGQAIHPGDVFCLNCGAVQ